MPWICEFCGRENLQDDRVALQEVPPGIIGVGPLPYCDRALTSSARGISLFWRYTVTEQLGHVVRYDDFP